MAGQISRVIPREELSEFQRWQFNSLLEGAALAQPVPEQTTVESPSVEPLSSEVFTAPVEVPETVEDAVPIHFPTAEEIEAIEQQAHEDGFQSGLQTGRAVAEAEVHQFRAVLASLAEARQSAEAKLADEVLELALVVARQLVRDALDADRTLILPAVREAIAGLPSIREPARLLLNPDDLAVVSSLLANELPSGNWRFVGDPALAPGDCRIESPVSSIDLGLALRWQTILNVLGKKQRADLAWEQLAAMNESDDHVRD